MTFLHYRRSLYLDRIRPFIGSPVIKVITGMRRVGKSVFLGQVADLVRLISPGTKILSVNMELMENWQYRDGILLHRMITDQGTDMALFLDEVQDIRGWEEIVSSLLARGGVDLYITGSNAQMLSSELATKIAGRYVEFQIYPLGLSEFIEFRGDDAVSLDEEFRLYLKFGGMPALHSMELSWEVACQYLQSVKDTVLLNDVITRNSIRNIPLLESVFTFLADNIGSLFSAKRIADYLGSLGRSTSVNTVIDFIRYLSDAFAFHYVRRYDLRGKKQLEYTGKAFLNDLAFRHALFGYREGDISGFLENIIYMELRRRGYSIFIGWMDGKEIDFTAHRGDETIYIQVAYLLASEETIDREFLPLMNIQDNCPKMVLSMDRDFPSRKGIPQIYIPEFLTGAQS